MFASPELGNRDPIYIYKQYSDKRPPGFSTDDSPFYLATRTVPLTDISDQWFLRQKLGEKNAKMLKTMAIEGGLTKPKISVTIPLENTLFKN
ncbi:hypothetical protein DPMN_185933 [Dreissena polymorpha]|uniref:Uncharacterized protein n=1 Tax=Dreissena polymorpha TaxID=45954 RepID=A0A9D4DLC7_DREPO|nr:hypothetical protein DPMN_185933 [Dreissena polymorpha]